MADFSAFVLERIRHGRALLVKELDLLGNFVVLRFRSLCGAGELCSKLLILRRRVNVLFFFLFLLDVFSEVFRVCLRESRLVPAPRLQSIEFNVKRPCNGEDKEQRCDQKRKRKGSILDRIIRQHFRRTISPPYSSVGISAALAAASGAVKC